MKCKKVSTTGQHTCAEEAIEGGQYCLEHDKALPKMLEQIAKIIMKYEDPTDSNCSNNVGCVIEVGRVNVFSFNGEKFIKVKD